jgi:hypothetical protein
VAQYVVMRSRDGKLAMDYLPDDPIHQRDVVDAMHDNGHIILFSGNKEEMEKKLEELSGENITTS